MLPPESATPEQVSRDSGIGAQTLERWLGRNDALFLWRDRATPMVVLPLHVWIEIARRSVRCAEPDADRERARRARQAEEGPLPPPDAIAEVTP